MVKCFLWILFQKWEDNLHYSGKYTYVCIICSGSKGSLKSVAMITISESDNWEINSSSGMKYGHFVDWEKIDPEAAARYKQILKSSHQQLKTMAREGFWATPHTLRAKAYYHIIHGINSRLRLFHWILSIVFFNRYFLFIKITVEYISLWLNDLSVDWCFIYSGPVTPDRDVYHELAKELFGEQKLSTHPVPEYMETGEIPRYSMFIGEHQSIYY